MTQDFNLLRALTIPAFIWITLLQPRPSQGQAGDCNANGIPDECDARGRIIGVTSNLDDHGPMPFPLLIDYGCDAARASPISGFGITAAIDIREADFDPTTGRVIAWDRFLQHIVTIDPQTGATDLFCEIAQSFVSAMAFDPHTGILYMPASSASNIVLLALDRDTASLSTIGALPNPISAMEFDSSTGVLYGVDDTTDELVTIDTSTAATTTVGTVGFAVADLAFDTSRNTMFALTHQTSVGSDPSLATIDTTTGQGQVVGPFGSGEFFAYALAVDQSGRLISFNSKSGIGRGILTVDAQTGVAQPSLPLGGTGPQEAMVQSIAYDANTGLFYGVRRDALFVIDPNTSKAVLSTLLDRSDIKGLAFDTNADILYATASDQLVTLDVTTGVSSIIGPIGSGAFTEDLAFATDTNTLYALIRGINHANSKLYTVNTSTGHGTDLGNLDLGYLHTLAFDTSSGLLYSTFSGPIGRPQLLVIDRDTLSGSLSHETNGHVFSLNNATATFGSDGLYIQTTVADLSARYQPLIKVDVSNGEVSTKGTLGFFDGISLITRGLTPNALFGINETDVGFFQLLSIDARSGSASAIGPLGGASGGLSRDIAFDRKTGVLYGTNFYLVPRADCPSVPVPFHNFLLRIDPVTGKVLEEIPVGECVDLLSPQAASGFIGALAYDSQTDRLLTILGSSELASIDVDTGAIAPIADTGMTITAMEYDEGTNTIYGVGDDQLVMIDPSTASTTVLGATRFQNVRTIAFLPNDCNQNLVPDDCDIAIGVSFDSNGNGVPDRCEGVSVPAASNWGIAVLGLVLLIAGKLVFGRWANANINEL